MLNTRKWMLHIMVMNVTLNDNECYTQGYEFYRNIATD